MAENAVKLVCMVLLFGDERNYMIFNNHVAIVRLGQGYCFYSRRWFLLEEEVSFLFCHWHFFFWALAGKFNWRFLWILWSQFYNRCLCNLICRIFLHVDSL